MNIEDYESAVPINLSCFAEQKTPRQLHPFLRGPVPLWWLSRAAALPGKALAVGIALWYRKGIIRRDKVQPSWNLWKKLGISRHAAYRGLHNLEVAGLISVKRKIGKNPSVGIVTEPLPEWVKQEVTDKENR